MSQLVDIIEDLTLPGEQRATVARFARRYFVLVGARHAPRSDAEVFGPYETRFEAGRRARLLQHRRFDGVVK